MEHKHFHYIHETGIGILVGVLCGWVIYINHSIIDFNGENFFTFILPPIIFAGGYNLKKEKFFSNFFYIILYAVIGTIVNFIVTVLIMIGINHADLIY